MDHDWQVCIDNAVAWARAHLGSTAYASRCLAFVEDAYERPNDLEVFGGDYAAESADFYEVARSTDAPPAGAFAFYESTGDLFGRRQNWGHVGLGIGDGQVIHAWDRVRVDHYLQIQDLVGPPGWDPSRWVGWAPVQRILEGSRPHDWTAVGDAAAAAQRSQSARFGG